MELPYAFPSRQKGLPPLQFGYLGAASPEKGLHVLLEAFRGFHDAELIIFGGTAESLRARYPQFADVLSQRNVRPKGSIGDHEKVQVLPNLDALIVPSIWFENSPVVIHEAFQAGIPVICSNTGGMAELVTHGVDGLHFEVGNAAALRRVLRECAATPDRLLRLAQGIRKPTGMRDHVTREIVPLYEELLGLRHSTDKEYAR
jgi:glycosyltransferase involved in cell wall biosynthesis